MRRKERSNTSASDDGDLRLPKSSILRGRRNFENLFSDSTVLKKGSLNLRFAINDQQTDSYRVGFISPKRTGNAVRRNRMKRLMREAFRHQKKLIEEASDCTAGQLHLIFMSHRTDLPYKTVSEDMTHLLSEMRSRLCSNTKTY